jgi:hypothetical protein
MGDHRGFWEQEMVEKRGRPALPGERYPSGDRRVTSDPRAENVFRRFAELEQMVGLDPRLTSQIGRLRYLRLLTDNQAAAADKIAQIYGRFERIHERRRSSVSPSYQLGRRTGAGHDHDPAEVAAAEADYRGLQDCIPAIPREARDVIEQLCVENCAISSLYLPHVRIILDRVAGAFGLGPAVRDDSIAVTAGRRARQRTPSRTQRFEQGGYAAGAPQAQLTAEEWEMARRDREATVRRIEQGNAQRAREEQEPQP